MMRFQTLLRTCVTSISVFLFTFFYIIADTNAADTQTCPEKYSQRLIIENNCADAAYAIITPPAESTMKELWGTVGTNENQVTPFTDAGGTEYYKIKISSESSQPLCIPDGGIASGNFKFYLGCDEDQSDASDGFPVDCAIGGTPGHVDFPVSSKFELTTGCIPKSTCNKNPSKPTEDLIATDFYDISNVDGYNIPMRIDETGSEICNFQSMESIIDLWSCPQEDRSTISEKYANPQIDHGINLYLTHKVNQNGSSQRASCASFDKWLQVSGSGQHPENNVTVQPSPGIYQGTPNIMDWYACNVMPAVGADEHPATCTTPGCGGPQCAVGPDGSLKDYTMNNLAQGKGKPYTNYVKRLKATGNQGYAWQFNDDASTIKCDLSQSQPVMTLTICPGQKGQQPYKPQSWAYINNKCVVDNSKDKKIAHYASLWDCQVENFKYTCKSEVVKKFDSSGDHSKDAEAQLNYCMPVDMSNPDEVAKGMSWDECNRSFCQERGDTLDVCILNKLENQYPDYLNPSNTPSKKMDNLLYRYYVTSQTLVGLFIGDDSKYSNKVLYATSDDDQAHIIGDIQAVARELDCRK